MNERTQNPDASSDRRFHRLVDGELSAEEYRSLLASLDDEPGSWRRCALAFLEAQALASELGGIRRAVERAEVRSADAPPPVSRSLSGGQTFLAVAASFLLAFSLGIAAPRFLSLVRQDSPLAGNDPGTASSLVGNENLTQPMLTNVGNLRLVMDGPTGESTQAHQVPVYEVEQDLDQFLAGGRPTLGPELIEYLQQHGYEVRHEQQYFPAPLDDGRQVIVPIDGYQITPVSRSY